MAQAASYIQSIFNKGEISPRIYGRVDNKYYYNSFRYSKNVIPYVQGAITRRTGTYFTNEVKTSANATILIPFQFSTTQNYILEFGNQYFRVYRNRGRVESPPGTPVEFATPWLSDDLRNLKFTQSADVLYVFCPGYQPRKITRTSDTSWTISTVVFVDGPYLPTNTSATTITPSATTGAGITLTASTSIFTANDVGRLVRIKSGSTWGYVTITAYTSGTVVTATVGKTLGGTSATADWRLGVFSNNLGWPTVGVFNEERLLVANTTLYPNTVWGSVVGDFENMQPSNASGTVADDDAFTFTISDDQVNAIYWMSPGRVLLVGTSGGEYSMTGGTASSYAPITPSNVTIKRETSFGSINNVRSKRIANGTIHITPSGQKVREVAYEFGADSYISRDMTLFSEHMLKPGIIDFDYSQEPDPICWYVLQTGELIGCTYDKQQEVEGWHRHILGGTNVFVESVAVIPKPQRTGNDVWLIVRRTINGATKRYIEYITDPYDAATYGQDSMFFVDSGLSYDGYFSGTLTPGATTGTGITFTASQSVFTAGSVGDQLRSDSGGRALITGYTNGTTVTATITADFPSTSPLESGTWSIAIKDFAGIGHLEGQTCRVTADGAGTDDVVISGGGFSIANFASRVQVGLPYDVEMQFLPVEFPQFGTVQGKIRRCHRLHLYLYETLGLSVGNMMIPETILPVDFQAMGQTMDQAPPLYYGIKTIAPPMGYDKQGVLILLKEDALPFTMNFFVQEMVVGD